MFRSFFLSRKWLLWAWVGSAVIVFVTWYQVQILVELNRWFGDFYNTVQESLENPGQVSLGEYNREVFSFAKIGAEFVLIAVLLQFFTQHYVFRWRTAMNDYYMSQWHALRHIEGAAQRVQDDTMRFAKYVERLGSYFLQSVLTLFAFIPLLMELSEHVTELPWIGPVDSSLVWLALLSAAGGTAMAALAGYRLPGLEFNIQKVEAAYRKELVYGEDHEDRAQPPSVQELFSDVRRNYFRYYLHYLYFNIAKYSYLQFSNIIPLLAIGPVVVAGTITYGIFSQILNAFDRVEGSFQYLVKSWDDIVELMSVHKRLKQFEMEIVDKDSSQTMPPVYPGDGDGN